MRMMGWVAAVLVGFGVWAAPAEAAVSIQVDQSTQTMHVRTGNGDAYDWPVSTARRGYTTPNGRYGVQSLQAMHYSKKYHDSPMPHSIFFRGGYAIHGTYETRALGAAASHGCVRLSPAHAAQLFQMVRAEGARIEIVGARPGRGDVQVARARRAPAPAAYEYAAAGDEFDAAPRRHRQGRAYGSGELYGTSALGYAPAPRRAATYRNWLEDPFGAVMDGY